MGQECSEVWDRACNGTWGKSSESAKINGFSANTFDFAIFTAVSVAGRRNSGFDRQRNYPIQRERRPMKQQAPIEKSYIVKYFVFICFLLSKIKIYVQRIQLCLVLLLRTVSTQQSNAFLNRQCWLKWDKSHRDQVTAANFTSM